MNAPTTKSDRLCSLFNEFVALEPTGDELLMLATNVPALKREACRAILNRGYGNSILRKLIYQIGNSLGREAADVLLEKEDAEESDFLAIMRRYPECAEAAWEKLHEHPVSNDTYRAIVDSVHAYAPTAAERLLAGSPTAADLEEIILNVPAHREEAWKRLIEKPDKHALASVTRFCEPLREKAWELFVSLEPTNDELVEFVKYVMPLQERAANILLARQLPNDTIRLIMRSVPSLRGAAAQKLVREKSDILHEIFSI